MILSMSSQVYLFAVTIVFGFAMGIFYDFFKILRKKINHADFITQVEDVLYWLITSFAMFYLVLNKTQGEFRGFYILGALLGLVLYSVTISELFVKLMLSVISFLEKIILSVLKLLLSVVNLLLFPFKLLLKLLGKLLEKPWKAFKKLLQKIFRYAKIKRKSLVKDLRIMFKSK